MRLLLFFCLLGCVSVKAQEVKIDIDLSSFKTYGATSALEREKFFNSHNSPGGEFTAQEWDFLKSIKFGMGRCFMSPNPGSSVACGVTGDEIRKKGERWGASFKKLPMYNSSAMEEIILTSHPTPGKGGSKNYAFHWKGLGADYSPEAKIMADFLKYYFVENGISLPRYIEPMNEPYVHANDYKNVWAKDSDVRVEMARYHKMMAQELHKQFPNVKVGGFASAWPYLEGFNSDFEHWNSRMKMFIDTVGKELDFVSFHIYDGMNVKGEDCFRSGSNMEAIMDIIEGYCAIKFGKPLPLLISEHGMTRKDWLTQAYSEERDWKILRSVNHQTMQFMQRPGNILKCIPFFSGKATWRKDPNPYPWVISRKNKDGDWEWTHLIKYFQFWKDLSGKYVDAQSSDPDILSLAFLDKKRLSVVLNNLEDDKNLELNLCNAHGRKIKSVKLRRLYEREGIPVLEDTDYSGEQVRLTLRRDETVIVSFEYNQALPPSSTLDNRKYYATEYLKAVKAGEANSFCVKIDSGKKKRALLQVGIARPHKKSILPAQLCLNGKKYIIPDNWKGYDQADRIKEGFFGVVDIPVAIEDLKNDNEVSLIFDTEGGTVSTVALNIDYVL